MNPCRRKPYLFSATPGSYEDEHADAIARQLVRPTGLLDPLIEVRPVTTQVDDVLSEINLRVPKNERVLVLTLTKRMSEDLTDYLDEHGVRVRYLHSDIDTVERVEIIRDLRLGEFDVLVGIKLIARRTGYTRGLIDCDFRCRQRRLSTFRALNDSKHWSCSA